MVLEFQIHDLVTNISINNVDELIADTMKYQYFELESNHHADRLIREQKDI